MSGNPRNGDAPSRYLAVPERRLVEAGDVERAPLSTGGSDDGSDKSTPPAKPQLHLKIPAPRQVWSTAEQNMHGAKKHIVVGVKKPVESAPRGCCAIRRACMLRLCARKVRGFEIPVFLSLLGSLVLPSLDAASDWAVTLSWYESSDFGWFASGLIIQLCSGMISGAMLTWMLREGEHDIGGKSITRTTRGGDMHTCVALPVGMVLGMLGLGPAAMGALALWSCDPNSLNFLKVYSSAPLCLLSS